MIATMEFLESKYVVAIYDKGSLGKTCVAAQVEAERLGRAGKVRLTFFGNQDVKFPWRFEIRDKVHIHV